VTTIFATRAARRRGITFTALVATTLVLMAFSSNPAVLELQKGVSFAFQPMQRGLNDVAGTVSDVFGAIAGIERLHADNAALRDENQRLAADNARLREVARENELLTGLLQLQGGFEYKTAGAQVIARESSEFRRVLTIDRGTDAGIRNGAVVIAQGGALAGRVVEVGGNYSKVMLITDGDSTVVGQLGSSPATGEVVGQLDGALVMGKVDSTVAIKLDDEVVTAGIELGGGVRSPYPKGLVIGQVIDVRRDANDVVQTAYLQPAADLDRLEYVLVVLDYQGGLPPLDQQPTVCGPQPSGGTLPDGEQPCFTPSPAPRPSGSARP
jgi:rod shape-determining protein MreC